ncbi:hypothetical protein FRC18_002282 [Serendipita sp. 400]|nr:hypothetical protein FRC18_002282 [Serendipita sp. 400]
MEDEAFISFVRSLVSRPSPSSSSSSHRSKAGSILLVRPSSHSQPVRHNAESSPWSSPVALGFVQSKYEISIGMYPSKFVPTNGVFRAPTTTTTTTTRHRQHRQQLFAVLLRTYVFIVARRWSGQEVKNRGGYTRPTRALGGPFE